MIIAETVENAVQMALTQVGKPYAIGGLDGNGRWVVRGKPSVHDSDPKDFDCSGFASWVVGQTGIILPDGCKAQRLYCKELLAGDDDLSLDLWFADLHGDPAPDHVVISIPGPNVIEARGPQVGKEYGRVIIRPKIVWIAQKGFLGRFRVPGLYD